MEPTQPMQVLRRDYGPCPNCGGHNLFLEEWRAPEILPFQIERCEALGCGYLSLPHTIPPSKS